MSLEKNCLMENINMVLGNTNRFAIEVNVNNLFHDEYIGEGNFIVHINNFSYGLREEYATVYLCIIDILKNFHLEFKNTDLGLEKFSKNEIAMYHYMQKYGEVDSTEYDKFLLQKTQHLTEWLPESAFDDGSHVLHFDVDEKVRLIGYKSCSIDEHFCVEESSVNEIFIPRIEFAEILRLTYEYLESLKD